MHYKNGRAAKVGDKVVVPNNGKPFIGVVIEANAEAATCNLQITPFPVAVLHYATAGECQHVEDAVTL